MTPTIPPSLRLVLFQTARSIAIGLLLCCFGCGKGDGVERAIVAGKVTLDGVAIDEGLIAFILPAIPRDRWPASAIQNGQYSIAALKGPVVGSNRVEITASKKTGRKVASRFGGTVDEAVEAVPRTL